MLILAVTVYGEEEEEREMQVRRSDDTSLSHDQPQYSVLQALGAQLH